MVSGKRRSLCTVLDCQLKSLLWTWFPQTSLMESVSDGLSGNKHVGVLQEVMLQGSGSAPPLPPD